MVDRAAEVTGDPNSKVPEEEHKHGERYSNGRKVPTVQKFDEDERKRREEAERQDREARQKGLSRIVRDPVTGGKIQVKDSSGSYRALSDDMYITVPRRNIVSGGEGEHLEEVEFNSEGANLSEIMEDPKSDQHEFRLGKLLPKKVSRESARPSSATGGNTRSRKNDEKQRQRDAGDHTHAHDEDGWVDLPMRGQRSNVLFYTLPDPDFDTHHRNIIYWFTRLPFFILYAECFRYFVFDFGRLISMCTYMAACYWIKRQMETSWTSTKLGAVQRRGDQALAKRVPESVEWLNALITAVWKQINPDIFAAIVDKLEDIMQASAPSIVHAVKVADIGHGDHAPRLLSMRYLDEKEIDEDQENSSNNQHPGDFVNVEVTVAYAGTPSQNSAASKTKNMHLLIIFYSGLANVLAVPIPVWTEIEGFIATLRLRLQFTPEFPYIKNTTFSLMGLPKFSISVVPLAHRLPSISNLPLIYTFVEKSIKAALSEYMAPKSYTIDLGQLLVGDNIARHTKAIGVIIVHLHRAHDLEPQDDNGLSDPYVVVALSNYGKPLYSSRIIEKTLNPVFEETCFVMVTPEALRSSERLSVQLWDSDKVSADDENGRVEFDIQDLVRNDGEMEYREDALVSSVEGRKMSGKLCWSVGFFAKRDCNLDLATDGSDPNLAEEIKTHRSMMKHCDRPDRENSKEVSFCPPDRDWVSGILHIQIHQAVDLYADVPRGSHESKMRYKQGQDTTQPEVEEDEAQSPSSYCNIMLNDQTIYRTRTKPFSNKPYFNAETERFVRDWTTAVCLISVHDSRTREHDALLGVIPLKLSEVFKNASQVSKNYPVIGGVGEAKVKISMIWESIDRKLPRSLLGWDVGNFRITSDRIRLTNLRGDGQHLKNMKLKLGTVLASEKIGRRDCHQSKDGAIFWLTHASERNLVELPCVRRHATAFSIEFHSSARVGVYACAILWLSDINDSEPKKLRLPVWRTDTDTKRYRVRQNRDSRDGEAVKDVEQVAIVEFDAVFLRGLGDSHSGQVRSSSQLRQAHEVWQAAIAHGKRERGDTYLVDDKAGTSSKANNPDPYAELNKCAANAGQGTDTQNHFSSSQNELVDKEGRAIVDRSAGRVSTVAGEHERLHGSSSFASDLTYSGDSSYNTARNGPDHAQRLDKRHSIDAGRLDDLWSRENNLGRPIEEGNEDFVDRRGGGSVMTSPVTNNRHSALFSTDSRDTTHSDLSRAYESKDSQSSSYLDKSQLRRAETEKRHREQRGSQQFKPFRTMKWAKDGLVLGQTKLRDKFRTGQVRRPDVETEV